MRQLLLILLTTLVLSGCATLDNHENSVKLGVQYATMKVCERGETPSERELRCGKIRSIAENIKTFASDQTLTLPVLETYIRSALPVDLSNADLFLANALISAVLQELKAKADADGQYTVRLVILLDWIVEATNFVGGPQ